MGNGAHHSTRNLRDFDAVIRPMNRLLVAAIACAVAARLNAGLTYRTETITAGVRPHTFNGVVKIEAGQSRFEVIKSDEKMFEAGSIVLSSAKEDVITVLNLSLIHI